MPFVLALFDHRRLCLFNIHWPLFSRSTPHAARQNSGGQVVRTTFPAGNCLTPTAELVKTERGQISTSGPFLSMAASWAIPPEKSRVLGELRRDLSYLMMGEGGWVAGADRREAPGPKPVRLGRRLRLRRQPPGSWQLWNGGVQRGVSLLLRACLRRVERLSALEPRLDTIVRGQDVPTDAEGTLDVAELCGVTRRFDAAARFYREAFGVRPALADDLPSQHRLHAAMAAARAGSELHPAKDDSPLDDATRAGWRAQALEWFLAERNNCAKLLA
jgi:hypothetical protein